ncbi:uncharacterized protein BXZ73DRAFT_49327 [Epithele typhae]|uniref:uncharacterized protein n=1 Tax=Epithele typhae TaxID=378194 RepID=UPI002008805A|nr:uncharacterized protein BXZ73DRAFT_49327 [Epithele typhae]KAH9926555.1 hypothetical protein BXZ73DRAFT_49327 [Epithele typhae]
MGSFTTFRSYFVGLFCETILYGEHTHMLACSTSSIFETGMHTVLAVWTMSLLLRLSAGGERAHFRCIRDRFLPLTVSPPPQCILGDAIVCWRTWVLYGRDWRVLIFPVSCIVGSIVSAFGLCVLIAKSGSGEQFYTGSTVPWFLVFGVCTFIPNFYSVLNLNSSRHRRRDLRKANVQILGSSKSWSALLIIVESGAVYCISLAIGFNFPTSCADGRFDQIIVVILFLLDHNGMYIMVKMLTLITGIYPTVIIVLVCLKMTVYDNVTRVETLPSLRVLTDGDANSVRGTGALRNLNSSPTFNYRTPSSGGRKPVILN